jgi:lysophospholipase L1-like esterase
MAVLRRKRVVFALSAAVLSVFVSAVGLLAADLYLHRRYERSAGLNVWGYRGPTVGRKLAGEQRIVYLGGSTAFGYGVQWNEAIPAQLEKRLNEKQAARSRHISVVNLAYNNQGAYSFKFTLDDYAYLNYDVVCLYEGYNDLAGDDQPNLSVFRHDSPVFAWTGYLPIFPLIFSEKAAALRRGGEAGTVDRKTVFGPSLADRAMAGALETTVSASRLLEEQFGHRSDGGAQPAIDGAPDGCEHPWSHYCRSVFEAVDRTIGRGASAVVITQPYLTGSVGERHRAQQQAMSSALLRRYPNNPRVQYVNLGAAVNLDDSSLAFDGMHLTAPGNGFIADRLVDPLLSILSRQR